MNNLKKPLKVRRRFHRAFFQWLHKNQYRFLTPPFRLIERTDRYISFTIEGLNPALSFGLSTWELGVHVDWQGSYWDSLIFFETWPISVSGNYLCALCKPEYIETFASREALWFDHTFEPFLEWVNAELTQKHWLTLDCSPKSSTWAHLESEPNPQSALNVPVWQTIVPR